jgi:hypothetical protein
MKTFLQNLLLNGWQRKMIAIVLAVVIWMVVNHSLTATKTISNIPVRVINIPPGKTVEGLQSNGILSRRVTLSLVGNKDVLEDLSPNDLEIIVDAKEKQDEWIASINKINIQSVNPDVDIAKCVSKVSTQSIIIRLTKLVTEKIPILVSKPIGDAPRDYQFLDVWPYQLMLTVTGPEKVINRLKAQDLKITFNLNDISRAELDALQTKAEGDEISFFVPDQWKQIHLPLISEAPIEIDDPQAKTLRIDFVRCHLLPIKSPIPVSLFFPPEHAKSLNPETCKIAMGGLLENHNSLPMITQPLYTKGVSRLFLQIVDEMLELAIIATPQNERSSLPWSVQFINPRALEDRYVYKLMNEDIEDEDLHELQPKLREEYLRNRFRNYMNRFQLFKADESKLEVEAKLDAQNLVQVKEGR